MTDHYDVISIRGGAGGGTLAYKLAGSGKRILLLERGDFLPREKENWDATAVFAENKYTTMERWYDSKGKLFQPGQHYYVGGNTKFFGAVLFRMRLQVLRRYLAQNDEDNQLAHMRGSPVDNNL